MKKYSVAKQMDWDGTEYAVMEADRDGEYVNLSELVELLEREIDIIKTNYGEFDEAGELDPFTTPYWYQGSIEALEIAIKKIKEG